MNKELDHTKSGKGVQQTAFARLFRSWFDLTNDEQKAVLTVLALFLLGLAVRAWYVIG